MDWVWTYEHSNVNLEPQRWNAAEFKDNFDIFQLCSSYLRQSEAAVPLGSFIMSLYLLDPFCSSKGTILTPNSIE